eukprot:scaffold123857_cov17-Prasinocladus_malaysianus.AAC.1
MQAAKQKKKTVSQLGGAASSIIPRPRQGRRQEQQEQDSESKKSENSNKTPQSRGSTKQLEKKTED